MKTDLIQVGKTYLNKSGTTKRKVLRIEPNTTLPCDWWGAPGSKPITSIVVEFEEYRGNSPKLTRRLYMTSFAQWAKNVEP